MNLEGIMLSETSQKEEDKYCMVSLICELGEKVGNKSNSQKWRIWLQLPEAEVVGTGGWVEREVS